jgi:hypothetical protein
MADTTRPRSISKIPLSITKLGERWRGIFFPIL